MFALATVPIFFDLFDMYYFVYVQCAAANGTTNPAGADAGLRVQEASRPKVCKRTKRHKTSQLHVVLGCEYLLYLLRLNDMFSIELSF